jgi:hypothetical protein
MISSNIHDAKLPTLLLLFYIPFPRIRKKNKMLSNLYSGDGITSQREEGLDFFCWLPPPLEADAVVCVCIIVAQQQRIRKKEISCQVRGN